ncbi:MAG: hypothetical protein QOG04_2221 [Actinomycetota bacterium]|jgi:hypothetical protein|nr:hypothetical protein [Actinomycetota bacterium]
MKKTLALLLALALTTSVAGMASAAKKKPKGPKPYKSEEVSIELGHSVQYGTSGTLVGITPQEFLNTCAIPTTNGFDAYVWAVPDEYKNVDALIESFGSGGSAGYDLDMFLFDESCGVTIAAQSGNVDESTFMAKGTAFILIHNFGSPTSPVGGSDPITAHFELKPYSL